MAADTCRLCLRPIDKAKCTDLMSDTTKLSMLKELFPDLNVDICENTQVCNNCIQELEGSYNFKQSVVVNEANIQTKLEENDLKKIDLMLMLDDTAKKELKNDDYVCRTCLSICKTPSISLFDSPSNMMPYSFVKKMCQVVFELEFIASDKPVICDECWETLQNVYNFRKCCLRTDKKLRTYVTNKNIPKLTIDDFKNFVKENPPNDDDEDSSDEELDEYVKEEPIDEDELKFDPEEASCSSSSVKIKEETTIKSESDDDNMEDEPELLDPKALKSETNELDEDCKMEIGDVKVDAEGEGTAGPSGAMEIGFQRADSHNLPTVDVEMVSNFLTQCNDWIQPQSSGVKTKHSARQSYGDSAVGDVQVKRVNNICKVNARICPEHKVGEKPYFVTASIDEQNELIKEVTCLSCIAALGGCKHAIAFLMWLHRRSEEPAPTDVICYWKKPILSKVGSTGKYIEASNIGQIVVETNATLPDTTGFFEEVVEVINSVNYSCPLKLHYGEANKLKQLSLHRTMVDFVNIKIDHNADNFIKFAIDNMKPETLARAERLTHMQSEDSLWFELRYGRITAAKLYDMAVCKTPDGSLVNQMIGVSKDFNGAAMARRKKLEKLVILEVEKKIKQEVRSCGFIILKNYGIIGASPDGVTKDGVIEVKCPISNETFKKYINENYEITKKFLAQINLQMLATNLLKGYFCVAHPDFERSRECTLIEVPYDEEFTKALIENAIIFWKNNIFPVLFESCS